MLSFLFSVLFITPTLIITIADESYSFQQLYYDVIPENLPTGTFVIRWQMFFDNKDATNPYVETKTYINKENKKLHIKLFPPSSQDKNWRIYFDFYFENLITNKETFESELNIRFPSGIQHPLLISCEDYGNKSYFCKGFIKEDVETIIDQLKTQPYGNIIIQDNKILPMGSIPFTSKDFNEAFEILEDVMKKQNDFRI